MKNEGTLGINSAQSIASPVVDAGTVTGTSPLTLTGSLTTSGANFNGPGTVTVAKGANWENSSSSSVGGGALVNRGAATVDATTTMSIYSGATLTNIGTLTMNAAARITGSNNQNAVFNNTGTLVVAPGLTGTASLYGGYLVVNNTGSIKLTSGTLDIYSTTLNLNGGSITGSGTLKNEGTLGINSAQSIASPVVDAGTVTGTSPLTLTGFFTTSGDTLNGPGTVTVAAGATWEDTSSMYVSGGTFLNAGQRPSTPRPPCRSTRVRR